MMSRRKALVVEIYDDQREGIQLVRTNYGLAISYTQLCDTLSVGDTVLLNCTATDLNLGTGGTDFVIARLNPPPLDTPPAQRESGHLMKLRYTPMQHAVLHAEEGEVASSWSDSTLNGAPIIVGELHSQLVPVLIGLGIDRHNLAYIMTDQASLALSISQLITELALNDFIEIDTYAIGQTFGGRYDTSTVNLATALLHSIHAAKKGTAFISQGPGQTGSSTKYGFSGIEQASNLDMIAALGGTPILCVRASNGDQRERHRGISHHTLTVLELVRSHCIVPVPEGLEVPYSVESKHNVCVVPIGQTQEVVKQINNLNTKVSHMGRSCDQDPLFFQTAASAGIIASNILKLNNETIGDGKLSL